MSDTEFPAGVHVLRPRKVSVSKKLDGFLAKAGLSNANNNRQNNTTRPRPGSMNAFTCADCGQIEYLTREYCRCGHYLRGQLEDEYLAWEQGVLDLHTKLSDEVELKLKPLRMFYLLAIPFILVPAMNVLFWSNSYTLITLLWWLPAVFIAGAGMFAEGHLSRQLKESAKFVDSYTFETFVEQRTSF